ncbi:MAG: hypothetical protein LKI58_09260 [Actinomyces sp.]|jgi:uncharacterized membrane protein|nr:hypothetical protein [Actinomyces sp.]MCI1642339.1 hypothetical protein [Actinomyces sp.]MCI1662854.1 hypothetical protein [Actinomyces sp.]MCI1691415.1 hypothetical protein [Actinomyces sp.]MCI1788236.1 hypothetical protein [Actinomyces sp.]MCI1830644.1 hypothetical protein [Actinomyces sp.]
MDDRLVPPSEGPLASGDDDARTGVDLGAKDVAVEGFVHDAFYERGHLWLKVRQTLVALVFWFVLLAPIVVLINSVSREESWEGIYRWTYADGYELVRFLVIAIAVIIVVVLGFSVYLLLRNNHREKKVYPSRTTYDAEGLARRRAILEAMYSERFGSDDARHGTRYYVVAPEQNLDTGYIRDLFRQGHTDVGEEVRR